MILILSKSIFLLIDFNYLQKTFDTALNFNCTCVFILTYALHSNTFWYYLCFSEYSNLITEIILHYRSFCKDQLNLNKLDDYANTSVFCTRRKWFWVRTIKISAAWRIIGNTMLSSHVTACKRVHDHKSQAM